VWVYYQVCEELNRSAPPYPLTCKDLRKPPEHPPHPATSANQVPRTPPIFDLEQSPERKWQRGQMKEGPGKHLQSTAPPSQITDPSPACPGLPTHRSATSSARNPMPAPPPQMRPDRHEDDEPKRRQVNSSSDGSTRTAVCS